MEPKLVQEREQVNVARTVSPTAAGGSQTLCYDSPMSRLSWLLTVVPVLALAEFRESHAQATVRPRGASVGQSTSKGNAATVEFQIVHDRNYPATNVQRWYQLLTELKVDRLAIRLDPGEGAAPKEIETSTAGGRKHYVVFGRIDAPGRLWIGKQTFTLSSRASLARWLDELRKHGPGGAGPKPRWGLSPARYEALYQRLAKRTAFRFEAAPLAKCVEFFAAETQLLIEHGPAAAGPSAPPPGPITATVERVSLGTGLAYSLSTIGLVFEPRETDTGEMYLLVLPQAASQQPWPIGWEPKAPPGQLAPLLSRFHDFDVPEQPVPEVLAYFSEHLDMDLLVDQAALERLKLDLEQYNVAVRLERKVWASVLRQLLSQFRLHPELRVDEANRPFYWVTGLPPAGGQREEAGARTKTSRE